MFKAIKEFREKYNEKSPKQKWQFIFDIVDILQSSIGLRVLNDLKVYWLSGLCGLCGADCFLTIFYTVFYYFKKNKFFVGLESTCLMGPAIAVVIFPNFINSVELSFFSFSNVANSH